MKLIIASVITAFLFFPLFGAYSTTDTDTQYLTIGLPAKPLPGQETGGAEESESGSFGETDERNSAEEDRFDDSGAKDTEQFEDWYEPDPTYQ